MLVDFYIISENECAVKFSCTRIFYAYISTQWICSQQNTLVLMYICYCITGSFYNNKKL